MILFWLPVAIVIGGVVGYMARQKGRSPLWWGLYGAVFNVIALAHVILLKTQDDRDWVPMRFGVPEAPQTCPSCGASVRGEAVICRHCRQPLYRGEQAHQHARHPEETYAEHQSELPLGDHVQVQPQTQQPKSRKPAAASTETPSWLDDSFARMSQDPEPRAPEPEPTPTPAYKSEPRADVKVTMKAEPPQPPEPRIEPKAEARPEPKIEPTTEPAPQPKAEPRPEPVAAKMPEPPKVFVTPKTSEPVMPEPVQAQAAAPEPPKVEPPKVESPKVEAPKVEPVKAEAAKPEPKIEQPETPKEARKPEKTERPTLNVFAAAKAAFDRPRPAPTVEPRMRIRNEEKVRQRPSLTAERTARAPLSADARPRPAEQKTNLKKVGALAAAAAIIGFLVPFAATFWPSGNKESSQIASSIGTGNGGSVEPTSPSVAPPPADAAATPTSPPAEDIGTAKIAPPQPPATADKKSEPSEQTAALTPAPEPTVKPEPPKAASGEGAPVELAPPPSKPAPEAKKAAPKPRKPLTQEEFTSMVDRALQKESAEGGAGGDAVLAIQQKLRDNGYDPGSIDGRTGPKTVQAIRAFQRSVGMNPDGKVDMRLMERLGIVGPQINAFTENKR